MVVFSVGPSFHSYIGLLLICISFAMALSCQLSDYTYHEKPECEFFSGCNCTQNADSCYTPDWQLCGGTTYCFSHIDKYEKEANCQNLSGCSSCSLDFALKCYEPNWDMCVPVCDQSNDKYYNESNCEKLSADEECDGYRCRLDYAKKCFTPKWFECLSCNNTRNFYVTKEICETKSDCVPCIRHWNGCYKPDKEKCIGQVNVDVTSLPATGWKKALIAFCFSLGFVFGLCCVHYKFVS